MPTSVAKASAWIGGFLLFAMFIAGLSRVLTTKESPKLIRDGSSFLSKLFRGVLK